MEEPPRPPGVEAGTAGSGGGPVARGLGGSDGATTGAEVGVAGPLDAAASATDSAPQTDTHGADVALAPASDGGLATPAAAVVRRGLLVQYDFRELSGDEVLDTSGRGAPMPLKIHRLADRVPHGVRLRPPAESVDPKWNQAAYDTPMVSSNGLAKKVIDAVKAARALTVELWLRPATPKQGGPARILALAQSNYVGANLQITHGPAGCSDGSVAQLFHIRVLDTGVEGNGCPAMKAPSQPNVSGRVQHLALTQDAKGALVLYVDGKVSANEQRRPFSPQATWSDRAALALGNLPLATAPVAGASESNGRFWLGEIYYVGIYDVALTAEEVETNAAIPYQAR
jgi:hypothetical protein